MCMQDARICRFVLCILLLASYEVQGIWYFMNDVGRWLVVHWISYLDRQESLVKKDLVS